jgi:hypothetical protein
MVARSRAELLDPDEILEESDPFHLPSGLEEADDPFSPSLPDWMRVGGKLTLYVNDKMYKGNLALDKDNDWVFTVQGRGGQIVLEHGIYDLPYSWKQRLVEGTMIVGHQLETTDDVPKQELTAIARHVSAAALQEPNPRILRKALNLTPVRTMPSGGCHTKKNTAG